MEINGRLEYYNPAAVSKTPEPMVTKFGISDEVGDPYHYAKLYYHPIRVFVPCQTSVFARGGTFIRSDSASFFGSSVSLQPRPCNDCHDQYVK